MSGSKCSTLCDCKCFAVVLPKLSIGKCNLGRLKVRRAILFVEQHAMCGNAVSYCSLRERFPLKWMVYHKFWVVSSHAGTFDYEPRFGHIHLCDFCLRCRTMEANGISCVGITASHYKQNKKQQHLFAIK